MVPDESRLGVWRSFLRAHARVTDLLAEELEREQELPLTWYEVLLVLHEAGGSLRMHDLAKAVLLSKSGLTRLVDRMAGAGLVAREACESDRRGTLAVLTADGVRALRRAAPTHLRGIEEHFASHLDDDEARVLRDVFDRLLQVSAATPRGS